MQQVPNAATIFADANADIPAGCLPAVLHYHPLAEDPKNQFVYAGVHGINSAEHTGLPTENLNCPAAEENAVTGEEPSAPYLGRTTSKIDVNPAHISKIDPTTKQATTTVTEIDMSTPGNDYLSTPNTGTITDKATDLASSIAAANQVQKAFVHPHFMQVDPARNGLIVTGEHTGNVGVIDINRNQTVQILPISVMNTGLVNAPSAGCTVDPSGVVEDLEFHLHGVAIDPKTGNAYLSDEGEDACSYEAEFILSHNP